MPATRPRPGGFERGTAFAQSSTRGASAAIFLITACAFCRPAGAAQPAYTVSQKRKRGPDGETLGEWAKKLALIEFRSDRIMHKSETNWGPELVAKHGEAAAGATGASCLSF